AAGQVGLSMYVLMAIQGIGSGWIGTKVPAFGVLAAQKKWDELDQVYFGVLIRSLTLQAVLIVIAIALSAVLHNWEGSVFQRWGTELFGGDVVARLGDLAGTGAGAPVLPPLTLGLLALATTAIHIIGTQALYLRAHGHDPTIPVTLSLAVA